MFDRTDPADLATLKAEVFDNPVHYGDPFGPTQAILDKLNLSSLARTAATGTPPLTLGGLWDIIAADSATATQFEYVTGLLYSMSSADGPSTDISEYRAGVIGLGDNQVNAAINALSRDLSQVEQLFGEVEANGNAEFVTVTRDDWFAARDS